MEPFIRSWPSRANMSCTGSLSHLLHDSVAISGADRLHRLEVVQEARVVCRLGVGRHRVHLREEPPRPGGRLLVSVPDKGVGRHHALDRISTERMELRNADKWHRKTLSGRNEAELVRLLDRVGKVLRGVCEHHHVGAAALSAHQIGREVGGPQRVSNAVYHLPAGFLDERGQISLEGMAERVVARDEEPLRCALLHESLGGGFGQRVGVECPLTGIWRTGLAICLGGRRGGKKHRLLQRFVIRP